ncbi:MAG: DEAD/DEAH box helicase family protein [Lachnospiraceae bacterium]|nr:DEAD/DEAH box helicase family protein [Lachnospiraceae bacterium]
MEMSKKMGQLAGQLTLSQFFDFFEEMQQQDKMEQQDKVEQPEDNWMFHDPVDEDMIFGDGDVGYDIEDDDHVQDVTCMDLPMDWENLFDQDERTKDVHYDSIPDALTHCLLTLGRVDIEFIASITGADYKTVINTLAGVIYQNPETWGECFYKGWETADEYLSGNLVRKWKAADEANKLYHGYFARNLEALEKVMPPAVPSKDIYVTLGSPWLPADIIDEFMLSMLGDPLEHVFFYNEKYREEVIKLYKTKHNELTGTWEIPAKSRYHHDVSVSYVWGTERMEALHILEKTLNMKTITVTDEVSGGSGSSGKKRIINKADTLAAVEKQKKMIEYFQKWVWSDPERKKRLEDIFEDRYGCIRRRIFDGSFLEFPSMSDSVNLYPYQKNAVARILFTPNTLLAHDVGSGKTYIMIAAGQEQRRMGAAKKIMYVVPNNIIGQWEKIFYEMYPDAKLLVVEPKTFKPEKRQNVLRMIRELDYDGIIIAYSCFEQIPLSKEFYMQQLREQKKQVDDELQKPGSVTAIVRAKKKKISKELSEMAVSPDETANVICFDELGIERLFVDEAHNFKNVPIETRTSKVLGINSAGSKKCKDMMDKVHLVQKNNDGKGVVLATGTPITNSVTDAYIMQSYLQSGELAMLDLGSFDSWVGMFAERETEFEIDVDTNSYRLATRFSKFHNLPELTSLLSMIADFHQVEVSDGIPEHDGYADTMVGMTQELKDYLEELSERAYLVRRGLVDRSEDNMLLITNRGHQAAIDLRLVNKNAVFNPYSKVERCAENVADIYYKTMAGKSTQLVFCDISTPKAGFNLYDELKASLIRRGIPAEQIEFIHNAETQVKRNALFSKVRKGVIRILIGSTFKLGLGVNIQDRLIALHHLDVPWRPADMTQREGRILRQGNMNPKVKIFRYITEGSFDAYSWQLLETKQRFISDLLSGSLGVREETDIADTVLNYAEVKALAVGNPLVKERVETQNELSRVLSLRRKSVEAQLAMEKELADLPDRISSRKEKIEECRQDMEWYLQWKEKNPPAETTAEKEQEAESRRLMREMLNTAVKENAFMDTERRLTTYRGFEILLPSGMSELKPYIWLSRAGKYQIEMADTQMGNLMRIDYFLEALPEKLEKMNLALEKDEARVNAIHDQLDKREDYTQQIELLEQRIQQIDNELGVKWK